MQQIHNMSSLFHLPSCQQEFGCRNLHRLCRNNRLHPGGFLDILQVNIKQYHLSFISDTGLAFVIPFSNRPAFYRLLKCCQKNCCHYVFVVILWIDVYKRGLVYFIMALPCFLQVSKVGFKNRCNNNIKLDWINSSNSSGHQTSTRPFVWVSPLCGSASIHSQNVPEIWRTICDQPANGYVSWNLPSISPICH